MEKVTGIGGFFFRAHDPATLAKWYADHFGVDMAPASYGQQPWVQREGPTVFSPFPESDGCWATGKHWMINFRVDDLAAMLKQLERAGIRATVDPETYPNGLFANVTDPEGNLIQLWEPR